MIVTIEVPGLPGASTLAAALFCAAYCFTEDGDEYQQQNRALLLAAHEQIERQIREAAGGE